VASLKRLSEFAALGLLDRVPDAFCGVLVAEVVRVGTLTVAAQPVEGVDEAQCAGAGDMVLGAVSACCSPPARAARRHVHRQRR
jgi:hypothetical protein